MGSKVLVVFANLMAAVVEGLNQIERAGSMLAGIATVVPDYCQIGPNRLWLDWALLEAVQMKIR